MIRSFHKISFILCVLTALLLVSFVNPVQKKGSVRKVVIDAGHGGHDPGTLGKRSKEKDIALDIALTLGRMIKEYYPDVEVIYTRNTDVFVELYRRSRIANENKADLFISIHCNGTKSSAAYGVETWVMGLHKSKENLEVAKKENASILMEEASGQYDGFDPNSSEANIIFSLYQNVYLDQSLNLATRVQKYFHHELGLLDRGVKQAGFLVLYKTTMPGILVETGFLSNSKDEDYLISDQGQEDVSRAVFKAFRDYKREIEGDTSPIADIPKGTKPRHSEQPAGSGTPQGPSHENAPVAVQKPENVDPPVGQKPKKDAVVYKVQIHTSPYRVSENSSMFKGLPDVAVYEHQKSYKYTVGRCRTLEEAVKLQNEMQQKGFKGAFVVAFYKGERISMEEARRRQAN